jgi:hypothetical protein
MAKRSSSIEIRYLISFLDKTRASYDLARTAAGVTMRGRVLVTYCAMSCNGSCAWFLLTPGVCSLTSLEDGSVFPSLAFLSRCRRISQIAAVAISASPRTPPTTPPTMVFKRGSEPLPAELAEVVGGAVELCIVLDWLVKDFVV